MEEWANAAGLWAEPRLANEEYASKGEMGERESRKKNEKPERSEKRRQPASQIIEIEEAQKRRKAKRAEMEKQEKLQRRREKQQEKASRPKMSHAKKVIICVVLGVAGVLFITNGYRIIDLNLNKAVYEQKYEEKLAEKARLEKELSLVDDPEYVGQQARDRFHMVREGEILYVFPEKITVETQ